MCHHEEIRIVGVTTVSFLPETEVRQRGDTSVIHRYPPPVENLVTVRMKTEDCPFCKEEGS